MSEIPYGRGRTRRPSRAVLDASAFYAGLPFRSSENYVTTPEVLDEIKHIKRSQDAIGVLIQMGRLEVRSAGPQATNRVVAEAKKTGDHAGLSKADISVLALCLDVGSRLVTDDFAVSNVAMNMKVRVAPVMTGGIRTVGRWVHYCPGCRKNFDDARECPLCGSSLKRKLLKRQSSSSPVYK